MRAHFLNKIFLSLFFLAGLQAPRAQKVEIAFRLSEKDLIPEGITYDPANHMFYISSINKRKIVKVDDKKSVKDFITSGQDGIGEVLGLKVDTQSKSIWACSNSSGEEQSASSVHQFDLKSGRLIKKWVYNTTGEKHFFNDLVLTADGGAFISDSDAGAVFSINPEKDVPELWVKHERFKDINGITLIGDGSVVVNASIGFFKIDASTKEIKGLPFSGYFPLGIDGLCFYKQSLIGIQNIVFPISINQYFLDGTASKIESARILVANHSQFDIPTTGAVVDNWFYFIGNSQLQNFESGRVKDPSKLKEVLIMRVSLK